MLTLSFRVPILSATQIGFCRLAACVRLFLPFAARYILRPVLTGDPVASPAYGSAV